MFRDFTAEEKSVWMSNKCRRLAAERTKDTVAVAVIFYLEDGGVHFAGHGDFGPVPDGMRKVADAIENESE